MEHRTNKDVYVKREQIMQYPPYLGNINHIALYNFEQGMLYTFPGHIATNANITAALANLVYFVNVDNASLAALQVLSTLEV